MRRQSPWPMHCNSDRRLTKGRILNTQGIQQETAQYICSLDRKFGEPSLFHKFVPISNCKLEPNCFFLW